MTRGIRAGAGRLNVAAHRRMSAIVAATDDALDETDKQYFAAALAGLSAGTLAVMAFGTAGIGAGLLVLFAGTIFVSALYPRWTGLVGVVAALFSWYSIIAPSLAPPPQGEYTFLLAGFPFDVFVLACLVAAVAYPIGLPFRLEPIWKPTRWPTIVAALASVSALVVALIVAPPAPAGSSFSITLPPGWSGHSTGDGSGHRPFYCQDYVAVHATGMSDDAIARDLSTDPPPTTPWICATVVQAEESGAETHSCSLGSTTEWL
jgi:hypothetical protein